MPDRIHDRAESANPSCHLLPMALAIAKPNFLSIRFAGVESTRERRIPAFTAAKPTIFARDNVAANFPLPSAWAGYGFRSLRAVIPSPLSRIATEGSHGKSGGPRPADRAASA